MPHLLRSLGAVLFAVLIALPPAWAGRRPCGVAGQGGAEQRASSCCAPAEAPPPCCCESEGQGESERQSGQQGPLLSGPACGCSVAPPSPGRPMRPDDAAAPAAGDELRARFAAQAAELAPPAWTPEPGRVERVRGAPGPEGPPRGGPERLHVLATLLC